MAVADGGALTQFWATGLSKPTATRSNTQSDSDPAACNRTYTMKDSVSTRSFVLVAEVAKATV